MTITDATLVLHPDKKLKTRCKEVGEITPEIRELAGTMLGVIGRYNGYGLAANQVGDDRRIIVYEMPKGNEVCLANPKIIGSSDQKALIKEGCLSFLGLMTNVPRSVEVEVEGIDINNGKETRFTSEHPFEAAILQHEIDHLDGVLFIDRVSGFGRKLLLKHYQSRLAKVRKREKIRKKGAW